MTAPRFTLETLQNIRFPKDADAPAEYTYTSGNQSATVTATPEELTAEEQGAALAFILKYCRAQAAKRGTRRRDHSPAAPIDWKKEVENWTLDIDALEESDYSKLLDCTELEKLLEDATRRAGKGTPETGTPAEGAGTSADNKDSCFAEE